MQYRLIALTQEIPKNDLSCYWRIKSPIYANEHWGRWYAGKDVRKQYDEHDRTDLMKYLYTRLHVHPQYWIYEWSLNKQRWELIEEIGELEGK